MTRRDIVLVVDDSPGTLGMLNDTLEGAGYTVLVAQSAAAALTLVERVTPDIVLLDAVMPGMDGFEACRRLRRLRPLAATPIIFMTGLTETEHVVRGLEAGGVDYVTKPVAPDAVVARIGVHLANARLTRSAQAALDAAGRFLLATTRGGRLLWSTPQAAALIGGAGDPAPALPTGLREWIAGCPASLGAPPRTEIAWPDGRVLELSYVGMAGPDELLLRVAAASPAGDADRRKADALRTGLRLTAREAEVLLWLAQGKPNRDIAEILGLSPRTVNKHLEGIYAKLGVENRAAAAALAVRTLGRSEEGRG